MPPFSAHRLARWFFCLCVVALSLPSSGCIVAAVTAGVAGAGAAGYAYWQGAVSHDCPAGMDQAWATTQGALADLSMPIVTAQRDNDSATIESRTGDGTKVEITLTPRAARIPADGQWTQVSIRVGMLGDGQVCERIFKQIDSRLAPQVPPSGALVPVVTVPGHAGSSPQTGPPPLGR
jgi:Protein of unknown function (DUF3568)